MTKTGVILTLYGSKEAMRKNATAHVLCVVYL